jgi:transposase InsO family protein
MTTLGEHPVICANIKKASVAAIKALHKLIFQEDAGRRNRQKLREFAGFDFNENSEEFQEKMNWIETNLTLADLIAVCSIFNMDYQGNESTLAKRICEQLVNINEWNIEEPDDTEEEAEGEVDSVNEPEDLQASRPRFTMSFRDVEDSIRSFSGEDNYQVETWLSDFEEMGRIMGWSGLQKVVFAKKSLSGLAKLFIQSERGLSTWLKLRSALLDEFSQKMNSAELHQTLSKRTMKKEESVQQYLLAMRELASRGSIEVDALIQYVVDGIPDYTNNKMSLYEAKDLKELKTKLDVYSKIKKKCVKSVSASNNKPGEPPKKSTSSSAGKGGMSVVRCYNCNEAGHYASSCQKPKREKGSCYTCGGTDHIRKNCPSKVSPKRSNVDTSAHLVSPSIVPSYLLNINLEICNVNAIVDTGSPISLLAENLIPSHVKLEPYVSDVNFEGVNESKLTVLGTLQQKLLIGDCEIILNFYVVPNSTMKCSCLLGRDFVSHRDLEISFDNLNVQVKKRLPAKNAETFANDIFHIDVVSDNDSFVLDIDSKVPYELRVRVQDIMKKHYFEPVRPDEPVTQLEMELVVKPNVQPFYFNPRRLSFNEKKSVSQIINDLLARGIIRPSKSQFGSPIVLVKKKSGEFRMAVDYRNLNKMTFRDNYPIPRIDDQIDNLRNKHYFTRLDLKDAFHHIQLKEASIPYTSFVTFMGQFEYVRLPFGLTSGPSFFMRFINTAFRELLDENKIQIYLDDLLIATETVEENLEILKRVLRILVDNKLELKLRKCEFLATKINYLGYRVSAVGITPNPENIVSVSNYPIPTNFKELHSFLGLVSYFRKFIKNFALIAKPLYDLLKSNSEFRWNDHALDSFTVLKEKLISEPVLTIYSPSAETELHCDASANGFGSVLLQKQQDGKFHPICYFSKRTTPAESKYHSFELEALAIVYSLERFRVYLQGIRFKIVTDCNSLKLTLERKEVNPRILRWSLILRNYDYVLEHRSADRMKHADALSRNCGILIIEENSVERNLQILQGLDEKIEVIKQKLELSEDKLFELNNGLIYRKQGENLLFYVPKSMEYNVISDSHNVMGHQGVNKTMEYVKRVYWFPELKDKVQNFIKNCLKCITYSPKSGKVEGKLHCPEKGDLPFHCIHVDHYGPLEKTSHRHKYIFEVIDAFTKFVKLYPTVTTNADEAIKHLKSYFSNFSKPIRLVADRGSAFRGDKFKTFLEDQGIQLVLIATGTPQSNGQIERINRSLTPMLAKLVETTDKWDRLLGEVEFAFNNSINRSTGVTPSHLLYGTNQIGGTNDNLRLFLEQQQNKKRDFEEIRQHAVDKVHEVNTYNENYYNKHHKPPTQYKVGDYVMLKNVDTTAGVNKKLIPKFRGPYVVKTVLDNDRYIVVDPEGHQLTQLPFEGTCSPQNMKKWLDPGQ